MRLIKFLPLIIIVLLCIFFFFSLNNDTTKLSSPLVGKDVPKFSVDRLFNSGKMTNEDLISDRPVILNIWSSWCIPCRAEHDVLMVLSELYDVDIYGLNYKDNETEAKNFIEGLGNPFEKIGVDISGRSAINLGVYGVPETFIIQDGIIIYKHIGPIHMNELDEKILPLLKDL